MNSSQQVISQKRNDDDDDSYEDEDKNRNDKVTTTGIAERMQKKKKTDGDSDESSEKKNKKKDEGHLVNLAEHTFEAHLTKRSFSMFPSPRTATPRPLTPAWLPSGTGSPGSAGRTGFLASGWTLPRERRQR